MQTVVEPLGDEDLALSELLDAIDQVGERIGGLSLPELRSRIDEMLPPIAGNVAKTKSLRSRSVT